MATVCIVTGNVCGQLRGLGDEILASYIPPDITIWNAAAPPATLSSLLASTVFLMPFILFYTGWSYWVFRGKVTRDMGYH